jgi:hypothetical protein
VEAGTVQADTPHLADRPFTITTDLTYIRGTHRHGQTRHSSLRGLLDVSRRGHIGIDQLLQPGPLSVGAVPEWRTREVKISLWWWWWLHSLLSSLSAPPSLSLDSFSFLPSHFFKDSFNGRKHLTHPCPCSRTWSTVEESTSPLSAFAARFFKLTINIEILMS